MPREPQLSVRTIRRDGEHAERREDRRRVPFVDQHLLQQRERLVGRLLREHQRAPGDAQAGAERRLVRAVAADVADQHVQRAVVELDGVVEVAAEQRAAAARPVRSC